jgi:hypothetical protein
MRSEHEESTTVHLQNGKLLTAPKKTNIDCRQFNTGWRLVFPDLPPSPFAQKGKTKMGSIKGGEPPKKATKKTATKKAAKKTAAKKK